MAPRGSRNAPKPRDAKKGDNALTAGEEGALSNKMLDAMKAWYLKQDAFKTRMKEAWERDIVSVAKQLGMKQGDVKAFYEDHEIETGKDSDSVQKAATRRARRLATYARLYAATHDGAQISMLDQIEIAAKAEKEAEEAANAPVITEDEDGE